MMLKQLKKLLEYEKEDKTIFDIVIYGSLIKGDENPDDIDILIIFLEGTLNERLNKLQKIKKRINLPNIDMQGILLIELFKDEFFAKTGIFMDGVSVFENNTFSERIGFESYGLFSYNLKNKTHLEKVKFNYLLNGRNSQGITRLLEGKQLNPAVIIIPSKNINEFQTILEKNKINFEKKNILIQK